MFLPPFYFSAKNTHKWNRFKKFVVRNGAQNENSEGSRKLPRGSDGGWIRACNPSLLSEKLLTGKTHKPPPSAPRIIFLGLYFSHIYRVLCRSLLIKSWLVLISSVYPPISGENFPHLFWPEFFPTFGETFFVVILDLKNLESTWNQRKNTWNLWKF